LSLLSCVELWHVGLLTVVWFTENELRSPLRACAPVYCLQLYTYVDVSGCVFLFLSWLWLRRFQRVEASHLDRHTVTASDYTVKVKGIPHNVTYVHPNYLFRPLVYELNLRCLLDCGVAVRWTFASTSRRP
jgi:hypothetical protein